MSAVCIRPRLVCVPIAVALIGLAACEYALPVGFDDGDYLLAEPDSSAALTVSILDTIELRLKVTTVGGTPVSSVQVTWSATDSNLIKLISPSPETPTVARVVGLRRGLAGVLASVDTSLLDDVTSAPVVFVVTVRERWRSVAAGDNHTCGIGWYHRAYCWGDGFTGALGTGLDRDEFTPAAVAGDLEFESIEGGTLHTCGVVGSFGEVRCWGFNLSGELGTGSALSAFQPAPLAGVSSGFLSVAAGFNFTCGRWQERPRSRDSLATTPETDVLCWGDNFLGQLGEGSRSGLLQPDVLHKVQDLLGAAPFTAVTAGWFHGCGLGAANDAYCWGSNQSGAVGNSVVGTDTTLATAVAGGHLFATITAGGSHTCGVTTSGNAYCWGNGSSGQLGNGATGMVPEPVAVAGGTTFASVVAGVSHSCGLDAAGRAYCWGENGNGQLGDSTTTNRLTPVAVAGGHIFTALTAGASHSCGLVAADGAILCWGVNDIGQLGNGTDQASIVPVRVAEAGAIASLLPPPSGARAPGGGRP